MYHQRFVLLFLLCCIAVLRLSAQTPSLTGRVTDSETNEALTRATVQLYRLGRDTTFVAGTYSDAQGAFQFNTNRTGQYLLRISFLGYKSTEQRVALTAGHTQALIIKLEDRAEYISALKMIRTESTDEHLVAFFFKTAINRMESELAQTRKNTLPTMFF